jgi:2-polyprenyl-6-methoxyphenol hydroxylase-like FAD-dependent oxidoreductase
MACGRDGYVGLVRLEDGRLNLATALDASAVRAAGGPGATATGVLAEVGWPVPSRLAEQGWRGTAALTRQAARLAAHRVFALGDAAGYVEPFTGEGMAWALAAGAAVAPLAARAAEGWRPELGTAWARLYRQMISRRQYACRAASTVLRHPLLTRALIHVLARVPVLATPFVRYLNGPACLPSP